MICDRRLLELVDGVGVCTDTEDIAESIDAVLGVALLGFEVVDTIVAIVAIVAIEVGVVAMVATVSDDPDSGSLKGRNDLRRLLRS